VVDVTAEPVAQSNIVSITAEATDARLAAATATLYGQTFERNRTRALRGRLEQSLARLNRRLRALSPTQATDGGDAATALAIQIAELEALRDGPDPTVRLETPAEVPPDPARPKPLLSILAALALGLVLGLALAFAREALDPRLRREEQLRALFRLPLRGRIPKSPSPSWRGSGSERPRSPAQLSPSATESYRTLRAIVELSARTTGGSRSILVTSSSTGEGKSTTALNLAASLAMSGKRVILIESDLRRPALSGVIGVTTTQGITSVLLEDLPIQDAVVTSPNFSSNLRFLLAKFSGPAGALLADGLFLPAARRLIGDAKRQADFVIIDSPPLSEVVDALPLAQEADEVLIVVRLGQTRLSKLNALGELLSQNGVQPGGFVAVGVPLSLDSEYYVSGGSAYPDDRKQRKSERAAARAAGVE
jgi:receptor protein-tyrosine kinase